MFGSPKGKLLSQSRLSIAYLISFFPLSFLRSMLYSLIFGYSLKGTTVGFGTVINVKEFKMTKCSIGSFNRFIGPFSIQSSSCTIGPKNTFYCGDFTEEAKFEDFNFKKEITLGENIVISNFVYFDVVGSIKIGRDSWIARGSEFWTHGANMGNTINRNIEIGESCYLGSGCKISPGVTIGNNTLVAMGSVVSASFISGNASIGGVPAKVIRDNYDWQTRRNLEQLEAISK